MENRVVVEPKIEPPAMIPTEVKPRQRTKPKAVKKGRYRNRSQYGIKTQIRVRYIARRTKGGRCSKREGKKEVDKM